MANFRTTPDILDGVLRRCGEITSTQGVSPWQSAALLYINQIHHTVITGGNELNVDVDEPWAFAKSRQPIVIQLNPSITAGTVSLTQGSPQGTFSGAPQVNGANASLQGWFLKPQGNPELYKISSHTSGSTSFFIDANFPQNTNASLSYQAFQLDYDLVSSVVSVDEQNDTLDFSEDGITQLSASLTHGSYAPATLATNIALALTSASTAGSTYTGSYDSIQRYYTFSSNAHNASLFQLWGAGSNYYRSLWTTSGFDYSNQTGALSYTGSYPMDSVLRLTQPARLYYGYQFVYGQGSDGRVENLDPVAFDAQFPLLDIRMGTPEAFTLVREKRDGTMKVRFNRYLNTTQNMRVEFEYIPFPKDLFNNSSSIPLVPRKFVRLLEFGASFYLMNDKNDPRASTYMGIAQQTLNAMLRENRRELERTGKQFGNIVARPDLMPSKRHLRLNVYGYDTSWW